MSMRALFILLCIVATPLRPQNPQPFARFLGTWHGVCADGEDFIVVVLEQSADRGLSGSVRLANMRGGDDGRCVTVVDPPSEKHALKIGDTRLAGDVLRFTGSRKLEFEMKVAGASSARLSMIGTASEENPWELRRSR